MGQLHAAAARQYVAVRKSTNGITALHPAYRRNLLSCLLGERLRDPGGTSPKPSLNSVPGQQGKKKKKKDGIPSTSRP